jgi:hypothetical protein
MNFATLHVRQVNPKIMHRTKVICPVWKFLIPLPCKAPLISIRWNSWIKFPKLLIHVRYMKYGNNKSKNIDWGSSTIHFFITRTRNLSLARMEKGFQKVPYQCTRHLKENANRYFLNHNVTEDKVICPVWKFLFLLPCKAPLISIRWNSWIKFPKLLIHVRYMKYGNQSIYGRFC